METPEVYAVNPTADLVVAPDGEVHLLRYVVRRPGQQALRFYALNETVVEGWCGALFRLQYSEALSLFRNVPAAALAFWEATRLGLSEDEEAYPALRGLALEWQTDRWGTPAPCTLCPDCRERWLEEIALPASQAAARKGCVPGTVKAAHQRGDLPGFVLYGVLHFLPEDVDQWQLRRPRRKK